MRLIIILVTIGSMVYYLLGAYGRSYFWPAAAVIPAPIAYIKVVAVKKLVVEPWAWLAGPPHRVHWSGRAFPSG